MKRRAFTLVEFLVSIAIIAILVSLLLPVIQKARGKSTTSQSVQNSPNSINTVNQTGGHNVIPWAGVVPPPPTDYFNDYAGLVTKLQAVELNLKLATFDKRSTCQFVVAAFPSLPAGAELESWCNQVFKAWKIGDAQKNNGVLWVVIRDVRKTRIEVGYGLEGVLPDARAKQILSDVFKPHSKRDDWAGGFEAGIDALIKSASGDYPAVSAAPAAVAWSVWAWPWWVWAIVVVLLVVFIIVASNSSSDSSGYRSYHRSSDRSSSSGRGGGSSGFSGRGGSSGGGGSSDDC